LVKYSFHIPSLSILAKENFFLKKEVSTFKPFSLINSFAIQDTQGETETDAEKNCKNE